MNEMEQFVGNQNKESEDHKSETTEENNEKA